jgi:hypothetical protein
MIAFAGNRGGVRAGGWPGSLPAAGPAVRGEAARGSSAAIDAARRRM